MEKETKILETERLRLHHLRPTDVESLLDLWTDPETTEHLGGPRERAKLEPLFAEELQDPFAEEYDLWPVEEIETGAVVGHCGLLDKEVEGREEVEINYIFHKNAWGKGYATEIGKALVEYAFTKKALPRLIALIKPDNQASARVAEKIGMHLEKEVIRPGGHKRLVYVIENRLI